MKKEEVPVALQQPIEEFQEAAETPYLDGPQQTFLERFTNLPLVRMSVNRVREVYENTKERNGLLRSALERGESTVAYSLNRAADVMNRTGLSTRLQKPFDLVDSSACFVLDKFEGKLPIITKSPYEIKLMVDQKVDAKLGQIQNVRDSTVEMVRGYRRWGTETMSDVKQIGADKVDAILETPYGQTISNAIEYGLNTVDLAVEKYLPEGHSHKNGNLTNGHVTSNGNGIHTGNLEHMKYISTKVSRRLSAKSHEVVDAVKQTSAVSSLQHTVQNTAQKGRQVYAATFGRLYITVVEGVCKAVDITHEALLKFLPTRFHDQVNLMLDRSVSVLVKNGKNGHGHRD